MRALSPFNTDPREQARASILPRRQRGGRGWILHLLVVLLLLANGVLFIRDHFLYSAWLSGSYPVKDHPTIALITEDGYVWVETSNRQQVSFEARKYAGSSCNFPTVHFYLTDTTMTIVIDPAGSRGCFFALTVPPHSVLFIKTEHGSFDIHN